jgi:hypothetical protein
MSRDRLGIRVSPNRRYFVDGDGEPFFWLADTAWPLFATYTADDAEAYLRDRAAKGFNVIQGVLAWGDPNPEVSLVGTPAQANWRGDPVWNGTAATPNERYFEHVDHLVKLAGELGLVMAMLPTWGYMVQEAKVIDAPIARAYGQWLGRRYRDVPNIVWITGGDREPIGFEGVWRSLAVGLREGDGGRHLVSYHPCGWHSSSYYFNDDTWLDFNMIETWSAWPQIHAAVSADYAMLPTRPVVLGEPAYENGPEYPLGPITPLVVRRQAWWTVLAGGFFTYGQDRMWRMGPGWTDTFDTPGARQMGVMKQIVTSRPWWRMISDQGLFNSGVSSERTLNAAMRTTDRTCAILYLASQCHVLVQLDRLATRRVKATFISPTSGQSREAGIHETGNAKPGQTFPGYNVTQLFSVPNHWEDAVLVLDGVA